MLLQRLTGMANNPTNSRSALLIGLEIKMCVGYYHSWRDVAGCHRPEYGVGNGDASVANERMTDPVVPARSTEEG